MNLHKSPRTTVRRLPARASYDRDTLYAILDEGLVCHVGFAHQNSPFVIPMVYGRSHDRLFLHGSSASRLLRTGAGGTQLCVTVTLLDGLVFARSAFHHSMNYRSAVILGEATVLQDEEKLHALRVIVDHVSPGRWNSVRAPSEVELKATTVLALPIDEASVKMRTGPPKDDAEDYSLDVWAGVVPLELRMGDPIDDPLLDPGIAAPDRTLFRRT